MIQVNDGKEQFYLDISLCSKPNNTLGVVLIVFKDSNTFSNDNPYSIEQDNLTPCFEKVLNFHFEALIEIATLFLESMPINFLKYIKENKSFRLTLSNFKDVLEFSKDVINNLRG